MLRTLREAPLFSLPTAIPALTLAFASMSCAKDSELGMLTVQYEFPLQSECEALDVERIRVTLGDDDVVEEGPCGTGEIVLTEVPAGTYDLKVEGLDDAGDAVTDNLAAPTDDEVVEVLGGVDRTTRVRLTPTPAVIQLRWNLFVEGSQAQCPYVDSKFFRITIYRNDLTQILVHEFPCDSPPGYQTVPDEERAIEGGSVASAEVEALTAQKTRLGDPVVFMFQPPGSGKSVKLTVTCEDDVCIGSGEPD